MVRQLAAVSPIVLLLAALASSPATSDPANNLERQVSMETRRWNPHEFAWRLAELIELRWAITDGISGRGQVGGEDTPAGDIARNFEQATGIRVEAIGGVLVAHRPSDARRDLEAQLADGGGQAVRAAWLLGHLKDARAWPALTRAAAGEDTAVALSAAHALRRLDGEENFDIRRWVVSNAFYGEGSPRNAGLTQVPLGACFENAVTAEQLEAMAESSYIPIREAAARIAPGTDAGEAIVEQLADDRSPLVQAAAERARRAWEQPDFPAEPRPVHKPDLDPIREAIPTGDSSGARWLAGFGSAEDIAMMAEQILDQDNVRFRRNMVNALVDHAAGEPAADLFRKLADRGRPWPNANHGTSYNGLRNDMGKYGLAWLYDNEKLADELGPRLGTERWSLSSEFLLARFSGPPALPHLETVLTLRGFAAPLAAGYIGGPDAVEMIAPLLEHDDLSAATAAARGLGESAQKTAIPHLIKALESPNRVVRSRAALALGRIGGPEAAAALAQLIEREEEYLPRRSATGILREIQTGDPKHDQLITDAEAELDAFIPSYNPVNPKFGEDFPVGELVALGSVGRLAGIGETRCVVDPFSGIWMRYGGCNGGYSNDAIGYDVASGKWFVIRPNETDGLFFNERRAGRGCSRGMAFCLQTRRMWVNNSTGFPSEMYPGRDASSYDTALDRFEGLFPDTSLRINEGPKWYVMDNRRAHIYTEFMGPTTTVIDTRTGELLDREFEGLPRLHEFYVFESAGYDPVSDTLIRQVREHRKRRNQPEEDFGVWLMDLEAGTARKSNSPLPDGQGGEGTQMMFDSLNRKLVLLRSTGAYVYDRDNDAWQQTSDEDCRVRVFDFDPQHNVFLAVGGRWGTVLMAFRLKNVPIGTEAYMPHME